jgi:hypothetical protein
MVGDTSMKLVKIGFAIAALAVVLNSRPDVAWATRVFTDLVTGEITAAPMRDQIEVDHRTYHIQAGSLAEQAASSLYVGQIVDLVLDSPATTGTALVMTITKHAGS